MAGLHAAPLAEAARAGPLAALSSPWSSCCSSARSSGRSCAGRGTAGVAPLAVDRPRPRAPAASRPDPAELPTPPDRPTPPAERADEGCAVRLTDFWRGSRPRSGAAYARSWAHDHVLAGLGGRTVDEAIADGEETVLDLARRARRARAAPQRPLSAGRLRSGPGTGRRGRQPGEMATAS